MTLAPEGRKLLRIEARNAAVPIERKPEWIKTRAKMGPEYTQLRALVVREGLHTVCQEAACPNIFECWEDREATFLIGGERCTRRCDFCNIDTGKPDPLDRDEASTDASAPVKPLARASAPVKPRDSGVNYRNPATLARTTETPGLWLELQKPRARNYAVTAYSPIFAVRNTRSSRRSKLCAISWALSPGQTCSGFAAP